MRALEDVQAGDVNMWGKLSERKPSEQIINKMINKHHLTCD